MEIAAWLEGLGLGRYEATFREHDVDGEVVLDLDDADLEKLGVSLGHRKRLLKAIAALRGSSAERAAVVLPREAERRQLTVMFVDLVDSTALSQSLDPEDMGGVLRSFQGAVTGRVTQFGGHVAKLLGDGVLAFFGWPTAHEDDAERAVRAGLAIVEAVRAAPGLELGPLAVRVGIATGLAVVGEAAGDGSAREEAVVGETPNLAARLQAQATPNTVVIAASTRRLVGGLFELVDLGCHHLKGFAAPVPAWRVLGPSAAHGRFAARAAAGLTPLVGRATELALLLDRWDRVRLGWGQVVLVSGEAGIGKSRLLSALHQRLRPEPFTPLLFQCSPHHLQSVLWPVIDQLGRSAGFRPDDDPTAKLAKLETLLAGTMPDFAAVTPLLAALLALPADGRHPIRDQSPQGQRADTLRALCRHLESIAARQPLLAVLEDAHWSDPTTLELFDVIVDRAAGLPILLLITFRPEFAPSWSGRGHATSLALDRLDAAEAAALVQEIAGRRRLPEGLVERLAARTDGVPLFVEELTKAVLELGDPTLSDGSMPSLAIPETLQELLLARLDRLAPAKEVAQIGAAIGREFTYRLLAAVAPVPEGRLVQALDELAAAELVFAEGTPPDARYVFKHALVQDAAYSTMLKSRRRQLHGRIAVVLEEQFREQAETQPDLVAHHAAEAGLNEKAIHYWKMAGERGVAQAAMKEAAAVLGKALALLETSPEGAARATRELDLQLALGTTQQALKGSVSAEAGATFARARALAEGLGRGELLIQALLGQFFFHHGRTELDRAGESAAELLRFSRQHGRITDVITGYDAVAGVAFSAGKFEKALRLCQEALAHGAPAADELVSAGQGTWRTGLLFTYAQTLAVLGYPDQAAICCDEAVEEIRTFRHDYSLAVSLGNACGVDLICGRRWLLRERVDEMISVASERAFPTWLARGRIYRGWLLADDPAQPDQLDSIRAGLAELFRIGAKSDIGCYVYLLADACRRTDRISEGIDVLNELISTMPPTGERWFEAELLRMKGELVLSCGDRRQGETCFLQATDIARQQGAKAWELRAASSLARVWAEDGESKRAHALLAPVHDWFTEGLAAADLLEARALLDTLR